MTRRLFGVLAAIAIAVLGFCAPTPPPVLAQVQQVTAGPASMSSTGVLITLDISGQSTCRFSLSGTWVANINAKEEAVGGTLFGPLNIYDDQHIKYPSGATAVDDYIIYPQSAGTIRINVGGYTSGTVVLNSLNCSPGGAAPPDTDANGNVPVSIYSSAPGAFPTPSAFPWPILPSPTAFSLPQMPGMLAYNVCAQPSAVPSAPPLGSTSSVAAQCDSHGNWMVDVAAALPGVFPTPQPLPTNGSDLGILVHLMNPATTVTAVPSCGPTVYPCGQPTPIPDSTASPHPVTTPSAGVLPTASAGATPPPAAPWVNSFLSCLNSGAGTQTTQATPAPTIGNLSGCQANANGLPIFAQPVTSGTKIVTTTGTYMQTFLEGENSCRLQMTPSVGATATVQVLDSLNNVFAGPYSVSGIGTTATFQLATQVYVVGDWLSIQITALSGTNLTLRLTCTPANAAMYQGGSWSVGEAGTWNVNAVQSGTWNVVTQQTLNLTGGGNVKVSWADPTSGTAYTPTSPAPVHDFIPVQPSPLYTSPVHDAAPVQPSPLYTTPVTTPAPIASIPIPSPSAGAAPPASAPYVGSQLLCYFTSGNVSITANNIYAVKCDKMGNLSVTTAGRSNTIASAAVSTCTAVATGPELLVDIIYANASAQTGTLEIFNEGASPTCAAADLIWVSVNHPAGGMDTINHFAMAGIAYEWLTNAQASGGKVLIDTNP